MRTAVKGRSFGRDAFAAAAFFTRLPSPYRDAPPKPHARLLLWGPAVGVALAVACALPAEAVLRLVSGPWNALLAAGVALTMSAYLTRGLHLDGLADTCDGLGAYRGPAHAREVMHQPDIGSFGVASLILNLLLQATALAAMAAAGHLWLGLAVAWPAGRLAAVRLCVTAPAAPGSVLGAWAAGSVPAPHAARLTAAVCGWGGAMAWFSTFSLPVALAGVAAAAAGMFVALNLARTARHRFGGVTGDVMGAAIEATQTLALLCLVVAVA